MIEYIKGPVAEIHPTSVVVDIGGVGYIAQISLYTYEALQGKTSCTLYIHEVIREDSHTLFGFSDKRERELFLLLISVSGVGANTARMILSSLSPNEVENVIANSNAGALKTVKGIGTKTAERIIIDLRDKVKLSAEAAVSTNLSTSAANSEAVAALVMLGFTQQASQKAVTRASKEQPAANLEQIIKLALKML